MDYLWIGEIPCAKSLVVSSRVELKLRYLEGYSNFDEKKTFWCAHNSLTSNILFFDQGTSTLGFLELSNTLRRYRYRFNRKKEK